MPNDPEHEQRIELPLACVLGPHDGPARLARWKTLHTSASPVALLRGGQLEVRYRSAPGVREELEDLASAEQVCCSFVTWSVGDDEGQPVLRVTSPEDSADAVRPIAAMFGLLGPAEGRSQ